MTCVYVSLLYDSIPVCCFFFFFSSRRRHTRLQGDWSSECALPIFWARNRSTDAHPSSSNLRGRGRSHSPCVLPMSLMNGSKSHGLPCQAKMTPASLLGCSARRCKMRSDTSTPAGQIVRQDLQLTQAST